VRAQHRVHGIGAAGDDGVDPDSLRVQEAPDRHDRAQGAIVLAEHLELVGDVNVVADPDVPVPGVGGLLALDQRRREQTGGQRREVEGAGLPQMLG
jgi:hypothetical protein